MGLSECLGESGGVFSFSLCNFGSILDGVSGDNGNDSGLSGSDGGEVSLASLDDFGSVLDGSGKDGISDGGLRKSIGHDSESVGIGSVADADFLAFGVDVSVAANLVTVSVLEVGGGLSGMRVAVSGLTQLVLRAVLAGSVTGSAYEGSVRSVGVSGTVSHANLRSSAVAVSVSERTVAETVVVQSIAVETAVESVVVETAKLGLGNSRQHQQGSYLHLKSKPKI